MPWVERLLFFYFSSCDLQEQFSEDADTSGSSPWQISVVNKNGKITPLVSQEGENDDEDEEEDDDEDF